MYIIIMMICVAILLSAQVLPNLGISGGNDQVLCYSDTENCNGSPRNTTRVECCDNRGKDGLENYGFSVRTDAEGCTRCPIS